MRPTLSARARALLGSRTRLTWLTLGLSLEVVAVALFQAPFQRFESFMVLDSGAELAIQDLCRRGYRPGVDFGYLYGLLPLLIGRGWYALAGLSPGAAQMEVVACVVLSAWGLARFCAAGNVGAAGLTLVALAIPDMLRVTYISSVQTLEQAILVNALAEQARGRRALALALVTACWFVKPSLAAVQGLALVVAILAARRRDEWTSWTRMFGPAILTAVGLSAVLAVVFSPRALARTILPLTGMEIYRAGGYGFFRSAGRDFWLLPGARVFDYFRYEVGFWLLGTACLFAGAAYLLARGARGGRDMHETLMTECVATCAAVHFGFIVLVFGHRGTWFYSWPMLILGLALLGRRVTGGRWMLWVFVLMLLVNDRSKAMEVLRRWKVDTPFPATPNLWVSPEERADWQAALALTRGHPAALLTMCEGAAVFLPGFAPPTGAYFVAGNPVPAELKRKAQQLRDAPMILAARHWVGQRDWPELTAALEGCEIVMNGHTLLIYRRIEPPPD